MAPQRGKKLQQADEFRAKVMRLRQRTDVDWRPYEDKWLEDEARRPDNYIYTDREQKILNQLIAAATLFTHYSGYSVPELIRMTPPHRSEMDLPDEEFLEEHYSRGTTALPVRKIRYLASLYRNREPLQTDKAVEAVNRETWTEDTSRRDYDEPFSPQAMP
jgi:hypothetical protein